MDDLRSESRLMCADMVKVQWKDKVGRTRHSTVLLEDISPRGACLQFEWPVPIGAPMQILCHRGQLEGTVRYCTFREIGYFVGIEFGEDSRWARRQFEPQHLLDVPKLLARGVNRALSRGSGHGLPSQ